MIHKNKAAQLNIEKLIKIIIVALVVVIIIMFLGTKGNPLKYLDIIPDFSYETADEGSFSSGPGIGDKGEENKQKVYDCKKEGYKSIVSVVKPASDSYSEEIIGTIYGCNQNDKPSESCHENELISSDLVVVKKRGYSNLFIAIKINGLTNIGGINKKNQIIIAPFYMDKDNLRRHYERGDVRDDKRITDAYNLISKINSSYYITENPAEIKAKICKA